jgi:hypothetical protein
MLVLAPVAGTALGVGAGGVDAVSVPQLQPPSQLPQTPNASVPVPQVPHTPVPAPQVSAPSAPHVSTPSAPSASTPQVRVPSASAPSGTAAPSPSPGGAASTGSAAGGGGSTPARAAAKNGSTAAGPNASPQERRQARARHQARERRLRSEVRRFSGCLGELGGRQRRFLSLRAGLDGAPLSRGEAAREVGIPRSEARGVERRGLRALRAACGGRVAAQTGPRTIGMNHMHTLQPASLLVATGGAASLQLVDQRQLAGRQGVKGENASSPKQSSPGGSGPAPQSAVTSRPLASASSGGLSAAWIAVAAALALMTALAILGMRAAFGHRTRPAGAAPARPDPAPMAAAAAGATLARPQPAPEPEPQPEPEAEPEPRAVEEVPPTPAYPTETRATVAGVKPAADEPAIRAGRDYHRAMRPATMIASGVISYAVRYLLRRRRGHNRRR